jgi:hypothetical protein
MVPAPEIESYDSVPWYRKAWFIFFPLFIPAALVIILTGDIYMKANGEMNKRADADAEVWRSTVANRACVFVGLVVFALSAANILWP